MKIYFWTALAPLTVLGALIVADAGVRLYAALLASVVFMLVQWLLPRCRFRTEHYLSPINLALFLFLIKLVIVPSVIMLEGPTPGTLSSLPSRWSMEGALLVELVAFLGFALALQFVPQSGDTTPGPLLRMIDRTPGRYLPWLWAAVGMAGLFITFRGIGLLIAYFTDPTTAEQMRTDSEGTLMGLLSTVLRPFLAFALIAAWSRYVDLRRGRGMTLNNIVLTALVAVGIVAANVTYGFNRAAFVFPILSLSAVFLLRIRRISPAFVAAMVVMSIPALLALGSYRTSRQQAADFFQAPAESPVQQVAAQVQLYGSGPQFLGFFLDYIHWGRSLAWGRTLVASAMSPVPVLGKSFRDGNGSTLYNHAIYNEYGIEDQILPLQGELFYNFHIVGVAAGYFLLGLFLGKAQAWFESSRTALAAYSIHYIALWAATMILWSLAVFSQIAVFFLWPVYMLVGRGFLQDWAVAARARREARELARPLAAGASL